MATKRESLRGQRALIEERDNQTGENVHQESLLFYESRHQLECQLESELEELDAALKVLDPFEPGGEYDDVYARYLEASAELIRLRWSVR